MAPRANWKGFLRLSLLTCPVRKSLTSAGKAAPAKAKKPKKTATGQREMLMAIPGKGEGKPKAAAKETKRPTRQSKAG
jgi:DNA end-binding protein Ku